MAFSQNLHVPSSSDSDAGNRGSFHRSLGSRSDVWGSNSIWNNRNSNALPSDSAPPDNSRPRDSSRPPFTTHPDETEGKTGSGSLVESSISEADAFRSTLGGNWAPFAPSDPSATREIDASDGFLQQSGTNRVSPRQRLSGNHRDFQPFNSRPPTINLSSTVLPAQPTNPRLSSGYIGESAEQPPFNVYTKFDRPSDPLQRKTDSAFNSWSGCMTIPPPFDERRPAISSQYGRTVSQPASRDNSLPPRHSNDQPMFKHADHRQKSPWPSPNNSRGSSISSSMNGINGAILNAGSDELVSPLRQLAMNGESRPNTSHRPISARGHPSPVHPVSTAPSLSRPSDQVAPSSFGQLGDPEGNSRFASIYTHGSERPPQQQYNNCTENWDSTTRGRYRQQASNNFVMQPNHARANSSTSSRSHELSSNSRQSPNWPGPPISFRLPDVPEHQMCLDPRMQQLMAPQLRNPYATMYNPYAVPNALQLNNAPPYTSLPPYSIPGLNDFAYVPEAISNDGIQSALMHEFKSTSKSKRYELRDIYDHIAEFSGDQHGSRFIQNKLETAKSDEKDWVFREIQPNAIPLMTDVFGNYVIQKFFEHGDQTHKKILANQMRGQVLHLSLQMYGCRVVQKAIEHVLVDQQAMLISELENHVLKCVKDQNGNHVIQKAIERCPSSTIGFIIAAFEGQVQHLSIHPYGCRVIQRCLEKPDLPSKPMIMSELMDNIQTMISDQFGNYVVQHIVSHDQGEGKKQVLSIVGRGFEGFSRHKFASNVVEKCLEKADDNWRREMVFSFAHGNQRRSDGEGILTGLIKDNYGNYVIQKLLNTLSTDDYLMFLEVLRPAMAQAKRTGCGQQVLAIERKMHRFPSFPFNESDATHSFDVTGYSVPLPTPPFASNYNSAATTPPPLTADSQSLQSSRIPSINGDPPEGSVTVNNQSGELLPVGDFHK